MNGAESLIRSLSQAGVEVCFANPGTSEMHLVQAIDAVPSMRPVLTLFEGVCSGAADGYGRMTGKPATTLLHLGPGLGNSIANLHNARRASTPLINLVGNHSLGHIALDAPLTSDIETLAKNVSSWIKADSTANSLAADGMEALQACMTPRPGSAGQISTLIIPADACWSETENLATARPNTARRRVDEAVIRQVGDALDASSLLLLASEGITEAGFIAANRIAEATGCRVESTTFPARIDGGVGRPVTSRLPYFPEQVLASLKGVSTIFLAGAEQPVSFFAYPNTPGILLPEGCKVERLVGNDEDVIHALELLADHVNAPTRYAVNVARLPEIPTGKISTMAVAAIIANLLPENAILCGDSGGGGAAFGPCQGAAPHTWLNLTGGSIGQGGPVAVGAAVACPDQQVLALLGDGAFMYTNQSLWTQARENLNVTTVIFNNRRYGILQTEYLRLGVNDIGERANSLFQLDNPGLSFVDIAKGMGVSGVVATTAEEFYQALSSSFSQPGPFCIEVVL